MEIIITLANYIWQWLKKPIADLWHFIRTNNINYIKIGTCETGNNYVLYLKRFSLLKELILIVKNNSNNECNCKKLNIHDITFDNLVVLKIPSDCINYSLIVKYTLKYNIPKIYNKRKDYNPEERIIKRVLGTNDIKTLCFRILER